MSKYIRRTLHDPLKETFLTRTQQQGVILAGIVGSGKTTLIRKVTDELAEEFSVFSFTGDSTKFRQMVAEDTSFILDEFRSQTTKKALVFIDEVQKSEAIFDAVKIAFDGGSISFIVSGSNPHYLHTIARQRLQRRASFLERAPLSLPEILTTKGLMGEKASEATDTRTR